MSTQAQQSFTGQWLRRILGSRGQFARFQRLSLAAPLCGVGLNEWLEFFAKKCISRSHEILDEANVLA